MTHDLKQRAREWLTRPFDDHEADAESLAALLLSVHNEAIEKAGECAQLHRIGGADRPAEYQNNRTAERIATAIRALKQEG
jgi:hypothetical protein